MITIKKEIIPKLCSKKSDTALPYIPSKLLIFLSNSPYTKDGSEGEYVANDTIRAEHDKIKLKPIISKVWSRILPKKQLFQWFGKNISRRSQTSQPGPRPADRYQGLHLRFLEGIQKDL